MKTIGLIGGMSWESTALYYAAINKEISLRKGGLNSAPILLHSVNFSPIAEMQANHDWDGLGNEMAASAKRLDAAGADGLFLATNTMHNVANRIEEAVELPFVHIADPTADALLADGIEHVGLLGTAFTMEMPFYRDRLQAKGLNVLVPEVNRTNLSGIIYEELCKGIVREQSRQVYVDAINQLQTRGAEAVILGCTEITMLIGDDDSPIPTYDTTALHARAAADFILS
ncbi:aspartate/glutamate racemase family protein [Maritalea porphyrae]|uniref:Racemase n=1 Tax=Maritalea porphyrae TaxID=880732 RepID=A0ABQ5USG4_9HYPH|nr:aspartate/glutamate racemase family protein [Maritalea porphyrae]GLQ17498.1 racemase [Maritalea porphyrae]